MNDVDFPVAASARRDRRGGRGRDRPVKVNAVIKRGVNEHAILADGRALPRHRPHRCASSSTWTSARRTAGAWTTSFRRRRSWSASRPSSRSSRSTRTTAARSPSAGATATARGEIGVISSVTQPFCGDCTRARISAEGQLYTCLFGVRGHDLRALVRRGASDEELSDAVAGDLGQRATTATPKCAPRQPSRCRRWR